MAFRTKKVFMNNLYLIIKLTCLTKSARIQAFRLCVVLEMIKKKKYWQNANMLAYSQQIKAHNNNERGGERQVEPWAKSLLPNNNKKHLCVIDQAVRGRWRAHRGQIDRNPQWSLPSFTKTVCGVTGDTGGRLVLFLFLPFSAAFSREGHLVTSGALELLNWRGLLLLAGSNGRALSPVYCRRNIALSQLLRRNNPTEEKSFSWL